jgi:hypothetical protein
MNAIVRFGNTGSFDVGTIFPARIATVVYPINIPIFNDGTISAKRAFPWMVKTKYRSFINRMMHYNSRSVKLINQVMINKYFSFIAQMNQIILTNRVTQNNFIDFIFIVN